MDASKKWIGVFLVLILSFYMGACSFHSSQQSSEQLSEQEEDSIDEDEIWKEEHEDIYHRKYFRKLVERLVNDPSTMKRNPADFLNSDLVHVVDSKDKKIRFYTWDYVDGGNSYTWHNAIQYTNDEGKVTVVNSSLEKFQSPEKQDDNCGAYIDTTYMVRTEANENIYLVAYNSKDAMFPQVTLVAYTLKEGVLSEMDCFRREGKRFDHIEAEDFSIRFDEKSRSFYLQNITDEDSSNHYDVYQFNGTVFEYAGFK